MPIYKIRHYKMMPVNNNDFIMPALNYFSINPHAAQVKKWVLNFFQKEGELPDDLPQEKIILPQEMFNKIAEGNFMALDAFFYPNVNAQELFYLDLYVYYIFFHDDYVESHDTTEEMINIINQLHFRLLTEKVDNPEAIFQEYNHISTRLCYYLGKNFFIPHAEKYKNALSRLKKDYYQQCLNQKRLMRNPTSVISENDYIQLRIGTSAVNEILYSSIEAMGIQLSAQESEDLEDLLHTANTIVALSNDIFSYNKEKINPPGHFSNYIIYKEHFDQLDSESAKKYVLAKLEESCIKFVTLANQGIFTENQSEAIRIMANMIGGNLQWSIFTKRYKFSRIEIDDDVDYISTIKTYAVGNQENFSYSTQLYAIPFANRFTIAGLNSFQINPQATMVKELVLQFFQQANGNLPNAFPAENIDLPNEKYKKILASNVTMLDAIFFPEADTRSLFFLDLFVHYTFMHDDCVESSKYTEEEIVQLNDIHYSLLTQGKNIALSFLKEKDKHVSKLCAYLGEYYFKNRTQQYKEMFDVINNDYFPSCVWQKKLLSNPSAQISENEFINLRRGTGGVAIIFYASLAAAEIQMTAEELEEINNLLNITNEIIIFSNDVFSYEKEKKDASAHFSNYIRFKEKFGNLSYNSACEFVLVCIQNKCNQFVEKTLSEAYSVNQKQAIKIMANMIGANLHWSVFCGRYNQIDSTISSKIDRVDELCSYIVDPSKRNSPLSTLGIFAVSSSIDTGIPPSKKQKISANPS